MLTSNTIRRVAQRSVSSVSVAAAAKHSSVFSRSAGSRRQMLKKLAGVAVGSSMLVSGVAMASDDALQPYDIPWSHKGVTQAFDHAAIRRGYEVYRQVCSTCHAMNYMAFRNLVGVSHTEEQAKALAASVEVQDGPNDDGEMFMRPGKLSDTFIDPYGGNEQLARASNGGAYPPDLSLVTKARARGADYVFSLLTGYTEPPAGVKLGPNQYYNMYFPSGVIGMEPPLRFYEQVEYEDDTPPTVSQMAHDVAVFLAFSSEIEQDDRKKMGLKWVTALASAALLTGYYKRFKWNIYKTRRIEFVRRP
eukprot:TRINITY_DN66234_c9_g2_i2.p1 TRINITY_DN66234_c9_g2~~TRINITY_DN66234_c9_g2_i2.p1  ORF type:complete len:305 (-),score=136.73 TRINITY_DN66234_c9_g2_i2:1082-1996(-)